MNAVKEDHDQYRTLKQFLNECDVPAFDTDCMDVPDDYFIPYHETAENWSPKSFDLIPPLHPTDEKPHTYTPTRHELRFLARYWTDRQLLVRYLDVARLGSRLAPQVDPFAEVRIGELAKILGIEAIDEIRAELLSNLRTKLGEDKWKVFLAHALDDHHEE